jgi:hypothetical protein
MKLRSLGSITVRVESFIVSTVDGFQSVPNRQSHPQLFEIIKLVDGDIRQLSSWQTLVNVQRYAVPGNEPVGLISKHLEDRDNRNRSAYWGVGIVFLINEFVSNPHDANFILEKLAGAHDKLESCVRSGGEPQEIKERLYQEFARDFSRIVDIAFNMPKDRRNRVRWYFIGSSNENELVNYALLRDQHEHTARTLFFSKAPIKAGKPVRDIEEVKDLTKELRALEKNWRPTEHRELGSTKHKPATPEAPPEQGSFTPRDDGSVSDVEIRRLDEEIRELGSEVNQLLDRIEDLQRRLAVIQRRAEDRDAQGRQGYVKRSSIISIAQITDFLRTEQFLKKLVWSLVGVFGVLVVTSLALFFFNFKPDLNNGMTERSPVVNGIQGQCNLEEFLEFGTAMGPYERRDEFLKCSNSLREMAFRSVNCQSKADKLLRLLNEAGDSGDSGRILAALNTAKDLRNDKMCGQGNDF